MIKKKSASWKKSSWKKVRKIDKRQQAEKMKSRKINPHTWRNATEKLINPALAIMKLKREQGRACQKFLALSCTASPTLLLNHRSLPFLTVKETAQGTDQERRKKPAQHCSNTRETQWDPEMMVRLFSLLKLAPFCLLYLVDSSRVKQSSFQEKQLEVDFYPVRSLRSRLGAVGVGVWNSSLNALPDLKEAALVIRNNWPRLLYYIQPLIIFPSLLFPSLVLPWTTLRYPSLPFLTLNSCILPWHSNPRFIASNRY